MRKWILVFACTIMVNLSAQARQVDSLIIFGDSLSDNGNLAQLLKTLRKESDPAYIERPFKNFVLRKIDEEAARLHLPSSLVAFAEKVVTHFFDKIVGPLTVELVHAIQKLPLIPLAPYWQHHFSNGPVWNEHFVQALGLSKDNPSHLQNMAFGGSWAVTFDKRLSFWDIVQAPEASLKGIVTGKLIPPSMGLVVQSHLLEKGRAQKNGLYVLFAGGNDYLNALTADKNHNVAELEDYANNVVASIITEAERLLNAGADNLIVVGVPDVGITPRFRNTSERALLSHICSHHNQRLSKAVKALQKAQPTKTILYVDLQAYLQELIDNADKYRLKDVTHACIDAPLPGGQQARGSLFYNNIALNIAVANNRFKSSQCAEPSSHLFWDQVHPSAHAHQVLANKLCQQVSSQSDIYCK